MDDIDLRHLAECRERDLKNAIDNDCPKCGVKSYRLTDVAYSYYKDLHHTYRGGEYWGEEWVDKARSEWWEESCSACGYSEFHTP